jgi:hypothetical protein
MPSDATPSLPSTRTFRFRWDPRYRALALPFGVTPSRAWVRLGADRFEARFGPWVLETTVDNLAGAEITGPYTLPKTAGPAHLSFADRGLTFASNPDRGVCVSFHEPVPGISPVAGLRHPGLTLTVDDVDGLHRAVVERTG